MFSSDAGIEPESGQLLLNSGEFPEKKLSSQELVSDVGSAATPGILISIIVKEPDIRKIAWERLLLLRPGPDILHHLLFIDDMREIADAEIKRLKKRSTN